MGKAAAHCGKIADRVFACHKVEDKNVPNDLVDLAKKISRKNAENIIWFP